MRILFFGTPDIAAETLEALCNAGYDICGVVTQPDKRQGRKMELKFSAVKTAALRRGLPVYQPERLKGGELRPVLEKLQPDLLLVIAYGRILPEYVLQFAPYGAINLHASILPKYRGAGPIQWAVINGERETGITVMQMDSGLDTGDILYLKKTPIGRDETAGELFDRMSNLAAQTILEALPKLERRELPPRKQGGEGASYAPMLSKELAQLNFVCAEECRNKIRGMNPWPVAYTFYRGKKLKVYRAETEDGLKKADDAATPLLSEQKSAEHDLPCGFALGTERGIAVGCEDGVLYLTEVQLEGGKRMSAANFLMGHPMKEPEELH